MRISYSKKETRNLGNYENVIVEIAVEDDVDTTKETEQECFIRLKEFVTNRLSCEFNQKKDSPKIEQTNNLCKTDIEEVKLNITTLINIDRDNKNIIKDILRSYGAEKTQDLNQSQLENFNLKLLDLLK